MPDTFYITLAYGLTWAVVAAYTVYVTRRVRRAEDRVASAPKRSEAPERVDDADRRSEGWTP